MPSSRALVIAVEGSSAAGKSATVRAAARAFGWVALREAYDRLDPAPSLVVPTAARLLATERRLLREEVRRYRDALRERAHGRTVVADTGFLGPVTYTAGLVARDEAPRSVLLAVARAARRPGGPGLPDALVYLEASRALRKQRARRDRRHHPASLEARHDRIGRFERRVCLELLGRILPGRVRTVTAVGAPLAVARRLRAAVQGIEGRPERSRGRTEAIDAIVRAALATRGDRRRAATVKKPARSARDLRGSAP